MLCPSTVCSVKASCASLLELEAAPPLMDAYMKKQTRQMIDAIGGQFCRGCGLCNKACPQGIQISSCNRMGDFLSRNTLSTYLTAKWRDAMEKTRTCTDCGACVHACPMGWTCAARCATAMIFSWIFGTVLAIRAKTRFCNPGKRIRCLYS